MNKELEKRLHDLVNKAPVVLFMKGDRDLPQCGFSANAVAILEEIGADFETFDIFEDEEVRQGLKEYSSWPTYPQLYIRGEFIGGLDIMMEMAEAGELQSMIDQK